MWDFNYTCTPNNIPLTCESQPLCGLQDFSMCHEQIILTPPSLMDFFLHCASFMGPHVSTLCVFYPWEPRTSPSPLSSTIENILCWVFFQDRLCGFIDLLGAIYRSCPNCERGLSLLHLRNGFNYTYPVLIPTAKGTSIILSHLPHTTMSFFFFFFFLRITALSFDTTWCER